jgi:hypothetical protein
VRHTCAASALPRACIAARYDFSLVGLEPGLTEQEPSDHAVHDLQHGRHQLWLGCKQ